MYFDKGTNTEIPKVSPTFGRGAGEQRTPAINRIVPKCKFPYDSA